MTPAHAAVTVLCQGFLRTYSSVAFAVARPVVLRLHLHLLELTRTEAKLIGSETESARPRRPLAAPVPQCFLRGAEILVNRRGGVVISFLRGKRRASEWSSQSFRPCAPADIIRSRVAGRPALTPCRSRLEAWSDRSARGLATWKTCSCSSYAGSMSSAVAADPLANTGPNETSTSRRSRVASKASPARH